MAIIVEEDKGRSNFASMLGWVLIVIILLAAGYYIFFAAPASVVVTPPSGFQDITPITQLNFDPTALSNSPTFQALKQSIPEPTSTGPNAVGRPNPFVSP